MKKQIKKVLIIALMGNIILNHNSFTEAFTNHNSVIINLNSTIIEQQKKIVLDLPKLETKEKKYSKGYATTQVNIREKANTSSKILKTLNFNTPILVSKTDNKQWLKVKYKNIYGYISKKYVSKKKNKYKEYKIPNNSGFKSYMSYTAITSTTSQQYKIQNKYAYTGSYGIRQVKGRFCVALGSYFNAEVGQYFDLVLENGTIIPCILGDAKANIHTDNNNLFTVANGCCSEFIIDPSQLNSKAKRDGNISSCSKKWNSPVTAIRVYKKNILK